ncbi:hypothetical protein JCM11251_003519 [Rhodosporidiobolus azoricus]
MAAQATQSSVLTLPYISLQPSTSLVIQDLLAPNSTVAAEDVWCSAYRVAGPRADEENAPAPTGSVHGRFRLSEGDEEGSIEVESRDGKVEVEMKSKSEFIISCPSLRIPPTPVLLPSPALNIPQPSSSYSTNSTSQEAPAPSLLTFPVRGGIETFALSSDGKRVVLGGRDGQARGVEIVRYEAGYGRKLGKGKETALRGHKGDLTAAEFFPSDEVVLTASSDMSLRVFSAINGSCPRELVGHTKRVTSVSILRSASSDGPHKGRLVLSASLDGTVRLWEVSSASVQRTWVLNQPVSAMEVFQEGEEDQDNVLKGKYALVAHTDGSVSLVDLYSPADSSAQPVVFKTSSTTALESISTLSLPAGRRAVALGGRNGVVCLFLLPTLPLPDITSDLPRRPIAEWRRTEGGSSVSSVTLSLRPSTSRPIRASASAGIATVISVLVASSDELPYRAVVTLPSPNSLEAEEAEGEVEVEVRVVEEFVGLDCEPATGIAEDAEGRVWISGGGGDGGLRVYERA